MFTKKEICVCMFVQCLVLEVTNFIQLWIIALNADI